MVYAESLSKDDIIKGIKNGKVYIRANDNIKIVFEARSGNEKAMLGDILKIGKDLNSFAIDIHIENCKKQKLKIYSNLGFFKEVIINSDVEDLSFQINDSNIKFLRVEIRSEEDNMLAITNPIFISY